MTLSYQLIASFTAEHFEACWLARGCAHFLPFQKGGGCLPGHSSLLPLGNRGLRGMKV